MAYNARISFLSFGIAAVVASMALAACDNGTGGAGGGTGASPGTSSSGSPASTSGTASTSSSSTAGTAGTSSSSSSTSGSTAGALMCAGGDCTFGNGGYAFAYADSTAPGTGTSVATLATDGSLCISGNVMALPPNTTPAEYTADWGCGIGVNLNQVGDAGPTGYLLTGAGVTVNVSGTPACLSAADIRVVIDQNGALPAYCATLTPGVEIPWSAFNTECWMPASGVALTAAPTSVALKVQFVTTSTECVYNDFCITQIAL